NFGLDTPAYMGSGLLHAVITRGCFSLTTPRGQIITALFVPPVWFLVGLSIRRMVQRRWRKRLHGRALRFLVWLGITPLPFGFLALLFGLLAVFYDIGQAVQLVSVACWTFYLYLLAAERLRLSPFRQIDRPPIA